MTDKFELLVEVFEDLLGVLFIMRVVEF